MPSNSSYILCSTVHDPKFKLKSIYNETRNRISNLFPQRVITMTQATSKQLKNVLEKDNYEVNVNGSTMIVDTYKAAIEKSIEYTQNDKSPSIFYIDFDRLLHWFKYFPKEISNLLSNDLAKYEYVHFGRNPTAFESHPDTQKETEYIINEIASKVLGLKQTYDFISVCYIFSKHLGRIILNIKNETSRGFYGIWPILFWRQASQKKYIEVNGLEWETPDRFVNDIKNLGMDSWLKTFQSHYEWKKRMAFIEDFIKETFSLVDFNFKELKV